MRGRQRTQNSLFFLIQSQLVNSYVNCCTYMAILRVLFCLSLRNGLVIREFRHRMVTGTTVLGSKGRITIILHGTALPNQTNNRYLYELIISIKPIIH